MAIAVAVLPIAADFEYYLMTYINEYIDNPKAYMSVIHERKYGGDKYTAPPSIDEIDKICASVVKREQRSRFSISPGMSGSAEMERSMDRAVKSVKAKKAKVKKSPSAAPPPPPAPSSPANDAPIAIAWWDFDSKDESMMSFKEGDKLRVLEQTENGWWKASTLDGKTEGYVPANYIKMEGAEE